MADDLQKSGASQTAAKAGSLWGEVGPVVVFIVVYNVLLNTPPLFDGLISKETAIYWATGALIIAVGIVIAVKLLQGEKIPPLMIVTSVLVFAFGTAGIVFQSKTFIFMKPTIINTLYAAVLFGGLAVGRNIWKILLQHSFQLPDFVWRILAIRWGLFFIFLAVLNEVIWRNFSEAFWANMKLANFPITMAFFLANAPLTLKYLDKTDEEAELIRAGTAPDTE